MDHCKTNLGFLKPTGNKKKQEKMWQGAMKITSARWELNYTCGCAGGCARRRFAFVIHTYLVVLRTRRSSTGIIDLAMNAECTR